jgi:hypothetical protein
MIQGFPQNNVLTKSAFISEITLNIQICSNLLIQGIKFRLLIQLF